MDDCKIVDIVYWQLNFTYEELHVSWVTGVSSLRICAF